MNVPRTKKGKKERKREKDREVGREQTKTKIANLYPKMERRKIDNIKSVTVHWLFYWFISSFACIFIFLIFLLQHRHRSYSFWWCRFWWVSDDDFRHITWIESVMEEGECKQKRALIACKPGGLLCGNKTILTIQMTRIWNFVIFFPSGSLCVQHG